MEIKKHLHITSSLHILKTIVPLHHCGSTQPTGGLTTRLIGAPDLSSFVAHVPGLAQEMNRVLGDRNTGAWTGVPGLTIREKRRLKSQ
ncbi:hypothetical protein AGIG_G15544 [Arapaima gigas]